MLKNIIAFEWRYHSRQPAFFAASVLFVLMGFTFPLRGFGPANVAMNSPYTVTLTTGFISLMSVFVVAIFAANAVLRDVEHRMDGIVFSTAVEKFDYLFGRFFGAFLATSCVLACATVGQIAARFSPWTERVAPFSISTYLVTFGIFTLPNVFVAAVLLFAIAVLTRNALATYSGAVVLYFLYMATAALTNSPLMAASTPGSGGDPSLALLDPFGLSAFFAVTRMWTAATKNVAFVGSQGWILANRAVWIGIGIAICAFVYRTFAFRTAPTTKRRVLRLPSGSTPIFIAVLLLWTGLITTELISDLLSNEYNSARYPSTGLIIETLRQPLEVMGTILLIFFGSELFWRERRYRFDAILNATPASSIRLVGAKAMQLAMMIAALIVTGILPGLVLQLARGPQHINLVAYLSFFASGGIPLFTFAIAVLLINALSPNKYAGMVFSIVFLILTRQPSLIGLDHPLWRYSETPRLPYSEVSGFGYELVPFAVFALHWLLVASLLFFIATAFWRARREVPKVAIAISLLLAIGSTVFLATRINTEDVNAFRAEYEKTYSRIATLPQPRITALDIDVDLYGRRANVRGSYEVFNASRTPISRVFVSVRRDARNVALRMRDARVTHDPRFNMYELTLAQPLQPGARATLQFESTFARDFLDLDADDALQPNGTFLMNMRILPAIGYRRTYEIEDPRERQKRGLPVRRELIEGDVPVLAEDVRFAATISTPLDQSAVAPGVIERTWTKGDRRYTRFTQDRMRNFFAIASARYAKQSLGNIELYFDPKHGVNAQATLDAAAKALEYCRANFGPYHASQLRMAEVPSSANFGAVAMSNSLFLTEHRTLLIDRRDDRRPDLLGRRIAHEVGHQWWGYEVAPGSSPGGTFIVESLAKYTELMVMETMHGRERTRELLEVDRDRYLAGRGRDTNDEVPLLRVGNQSHIYYGKGAMVLYAIRDLLGESTLNGALRAFVAEQVPRHGLTRATELLPHLRRVATDEQYALIEQWLNDIVLYDFTIESARVTNGVVTMHVLAKKTHADGEGNERPLPIAEAIDIRILDANGEPLYERKHVLDGDDVLTIPVKGAARFVEVDPWLLRIDTKLEDNRARVE